MSSSAGQHVYRTAIGCTLWLLAFVVLSVGGILGVGWLHDSDYQGPAWPPTAALLLCGYAGFLSMSLVGWSPHTLGGRLAVGAASAAVTLLWFFCFYVWAWLVFSGW